MRENDQRPDPSQLLHELKTNESQRGKLKIFFGYAAGVGKTYAMLDETQNLLAGGLDVLIGYIEPHTRPATMQLLTGLPIVPPLTISYKGLLLKEFDLDTVLQQKPKLVVVDELAHTNAVGCRNKKRFQDVEELLNEGIDVFTTVNVQHLESLNDIVENITGIPIKETIPDYLFDDADFVKLIDVEPEELLRRLADGKVYQSKQANLAMNNFFTLDKLCLLREIAMRKVTNRISNDNLHEYSKSGKSISQRFLVCIGPSPSSARCIRWTARTAQTFKVPWTVLYIKTPASDLFTDQQQQTIQKHLALAERLGAQSVSLNGYNIAETIADYAKLTGITNIVIGKSKSTRQLRSFWKRSLEDDLIRRLVNVEVYIISDHDIKAQNNSLTAAIRQFKLMIKPLDLIKMLTMLIGATVSSFILRAVGIGEQNIIMIFILSVLMVSRFTDGYLYGVLASVLSVLTFNFFFVEPYYTFNAIQVGYPITFLIMLIVALLTSTVMVRSKTQARLAVEHEHQTRVLYEINKQLLMTRESSDVAELIVEAVRSLLNRPVILYLDDPLEQVREAPAKSAEISGLNSSDEQAVAHWSYVNRKEAGFGTDTLMGSGGLYLPILSHAEIFGVIGIWCQENRILNYDEHGLLQMIVSLTAMALERCRLSQQQNAIMMENEKEQMRSNLLRAISHDLRTPLTAISGASSALLENRKKMNESTEILLLRDINEDAQWLIRMVENLLSVTKIKDASASIIKTSELAEEVIAEAVQRVKSRFRSAEINVSVPAEALFVRMDATLIEQVLINLLENALKYSQPQTPVTLEVRKEPDWVKFSVIDQEKDSKRWDFSMNNNEKPTMDANRGMGIGLSICQSIIKAHNGLIGAYKADEKVVFYFQLPIDKGEKYEN